MRKPVRSGRKAEPISRSAKARWPGIWIQLLNRPAVTELLVASVKHGAYERKNPPGQFWNLKACRQGREFARLLFRQFTVFHSTGSATKMTFRCRFAARGRLSKVYEQTIIPIILAALLVGCSKPKRRGYLDGDGTGTLRLSSRIWKPALISIARNPMAAAPR